MAFKKATTKKTKKKTGGKGTPNPATPIADVTAPKDPPLPNQPTAQPNRKRVVATDLFGDVVHYNDVISVVKTKMPDGDTQHLLETDRGRVVLSNMKLVDIDG